MPVGFKEITVSFQQMSDGLLTIGEIPGDTGLGPSIAVINVVGYNFVVPPNPPVSMQLFPSGRLTNQPNSESPISAQATFVNNGDDIHYSITGGGEAEFTEGFWAQAIRGQCDNSTGQYDFQIQFITLDPNSDTDFPDTLPDSPENVEISEDPSYDPEEEKGSVEFTWDLNPDKSTVILRDNVAVGSTPPGVNTFTDFVFEPGDFLYTLRFYSYGPNAISDDSASIPVSFNATLPDIAIVGSGGIDFGGSAALVFIGDPSGIYTLIPGKTHDTLYERTDVDSVDVKIPDPYVKTAFLGE